ncbi:hypothetical protein OIU76_029168 [Salix suchowensis]|nr:hypothetical protein OIU76_029168 [Salix suchowensis]
MFAADFGFGFHWCCKSHQIKMKERLGGSAVGPMAVPMCGGTWSTQGGAGIAVMSIRCGLPLSCQSIQVAACWSLEVERGR